MAKNKALLVIPTKQGQLGNRLIQYSHIMAAAIEHEVPVIHCAFSEYLDLFEATKRELFAFFFEAADIFNLSIVDLYFKVIAEVLAIVGEEQDQGTAEFRSIIASKKLALNSSITTDEQRALLSDLSRYLADALRREELQLTDFKILTTTDEGPLISLDSQEFIDLLQKPEIILCDGWLFRAPSYLQKHSEKIRRYFHPPAQNASRISAHLKPLRERSDMLVGVHIRYRDYREFQGGKNFYPLSVYVDMMDKVRKMVLHKTVSFLICSDEDQPNAPFADFLYKFGTGNVIEDMYGLAACDMIVGPSSTFSAWAAFYGGIPCYEVGRPLEPDQLLQRL